MTAKKLDCTKYSNDKMKWNKSEQRLKRQQSRPIWGSACKHGWSSLKTDIECNKEVWICMILESFRQWCSKSLMHNTRSGLEYVYVPNKNLQASRLDFDRQFSCFSSLPPLPLAILAVGSLWYLMIERTWYITRCSELKFSFSWRTSTVLSLSPDDFFVLWFFWCDELFIKIWWWSLSQGRL